MYANTPFDCDGAQIRACSRQLATVVTVIGVLDDANLDRVSQYAKRFVLREKPVVLDLGGVSSATPHIISLLSEMDDACSAAGVDWSLIASQPVTRAVRAFDDRLELPTVATVADALNQFADAMMERRRLLPLLTKSA
ncbi:STAS domain-containing protein [Mycolicibacterium moriokaense]|jgi:anti-anti-sigma regulatory factor|uniref:Anti-sigma-factor antagonist n=1 Tax=Mycolicibacterium moriokaense TaxID=39691 RepID=A0A318H7B4_9MYCO|nr:STAS domain-containing protein [Mycolicibacterium moriokaense]PXW99900.1 anti-sigma-factor antagonist [Mycolicibacterium moriokaense]